MKLPTRLENIIISEVDKIKNFQLKSFNAPKLIFDSKVSKVLGIDPSTL